MLFPYITLLLHIFQGTGVGGAKFTLRNNCSETIWPAIEGEPTLSGQKLHPGNSVAVQASATTWVGSLWGRTGCNFSTSGNGSCATGDCGSGQLDCHIVPSATTLAVLTIGGPGQNNISNYYVSTISGYNLPLLLQGIGTSHSAGCEPAGCANDLNPLCPSKLRIQGGRACLSVCNNFVCSNASKYSSVVFKKTCPNIRTTARGRDFVCKV